MPDIFISYRRADSAAMCDRIYEHLLKGFPADAVFRDVDSIAMGDNFRQRIQDVLVQCAAQVVIIGARWVDITDEAGKQRLFMPNDLVRIEIELALRMGLSIFPLLVDRASMPDAAELPRDIRLLSSLNAGQIRYDPDFITDIDHVRTGLSYVVSTSLPDERSVVHLKNLEDSERSSERSQDTGRWPDVVELRSGPGVDDARPEQQEVTAYYPLDVPAEQWESLRIYFHNQASRDQVRADAESKLGVPDVIRTRYHVQDTTKLTEGTTIHLTPTGAGLAFEPLSARTTRKGDWNTIEFQVKASRTLSGEAATSVIELLDGSSQLTALKLPFLCSATAGPLESSAATEVGLYRNIFISYSHKDAAIVTAIRNAYAALGVHVMLPEEQLRSGQDFAQTIQRLIDSADIFQLMWSKNAATSPWVLQEWTYALSLNRGEGFIRPVYWETSLPPPPAPLAHLHFARVEVPASAKRSLLSRLTRRE